MLLEDWNHPSLIGKKKRQWKQMVWTDRNKDSDLVIVTLCLCPGLAKVLRVLCMEFLVVVVTCRLCITSVTRNCMTRHCSVSVGHQYIPLGQYLYHGQWWPAVGALMPSKHTSLLWVQGDWFNMLRHLRPLLDLPSSICIPCDEELVTQLEELENLIRSWSFSFCQQIHLFL